MYYLLFDCTCIHMYHVQKLHIIVLPASINYCNVNSSIFPVGNSKWVVTLFHVLWCPTNYSSVQETMEPYLYCVREVMHWVVTVLTDVHHELYPLFHCVAKRSLLTKLALLM